MLLPFQFKKQELSIFLKNSKKAIFSWKYWYINYLLQLLTTQKSSFYWDFKQFTTQQNILWYYLDQICDLFILGLILLLSNICKFCWRVSCIFYSFGQREIGALNFLLRSASTASRVFINFLRLCTRLYPFSLIIFVLTILLDHQHSFPNLVFHLGPGELFGLHGCQNPY